MQHQQMLRRVAQGGLIAAMYTVLTLILPVASFGQVQFRASEMLTILPVFTPAAIPGLAVGCFVSNLLGLTLGLNSAGAWDLVFGTAATLLAALLTYRLRDIRWKGLPVLSTLPPVLVNAVIVGLELSIMLFGFSWETYGLCMAWVALGQVGACMICGLALFAVLEKSGVSRRLFAK